MSRRKFRGKTVLITGATGGLGRAMSLRFGEAGATIVGVDLKKDSLDALREELVEKHITFHGYECDVTDLEKTREVSGKVLEDLDGVDLLINNAGISHLSWFKDTDLSVYRTG